MFFIQPDDLTRLDIVGGNCYNASIKQNLTFGTQDELLWDPQLCRLAHSGQAAGPARCWSSYAVPFCSL